jgi:hypothetical protein|tara:strand:+ start:1635 stop:1886 length:252 start_codon:yes stop_codon:yes gene_type:complete
MQLTEQSASELLNSLAALEEATQFAGEVITTWLDARRGEYDDSQAEELAASEAWDKTDGAAELRAEAISVARQLGVISQGTGE